MKHCFCITLMLALGCIIWSIGLRRVNFCFGEPFSLAFDVYHLGIMLPTGQLGQFLFLDLVCHSFVNV